MKCSSIASNSAIPVVASVAPATTWLLTTGWRRHGSLDIHELPQHQKHAGRSRTNLAHSSQRAASR
ncbi:MAG: hypothetical protein JNM84_15725 [Planctomycetes bacterium]|nr:hypothetical protein [Planctomycetota bacterium]